MQILTRNDYSEGALPIQFCLNAEEKEMVRSGGIENFFVFMIVWAGGAVRKRFLTPLSQAMQYVAFNRPGRQVVHLFLVRPSSGSDRKSLKKKLMGKKSGSYKFGLYGVVGNDGELGSGWKHNLGEQCVAEANVSQAFDVPKEYFAKEPPQWLRSWVTLMLPWELRDECDLRGRFIYAFTIQPFIVLLMILIRLIVAVFLGIVLGYRRVDWSPIWKIGMDTEDIWFNVTEYHKRSSFWFENSKGRRHPIFLMLFHPLILLVAGAATLFLDLQLVLTLFVVIFGILLVSSIAAFLLTAVGSKLKYASTPKLFKRLGAMIDKWLEDLQKSWAESAKLKSADATEKALEVLACDLGDAKPRPTPTMKLIYDGVKAKVCKPFAVN